MQGTCTHKVLAHRTHVTRFCNVVQVDNVVTENDKLQDRLVQMGDLAASLAAQETKHPATGSAQALLKEENMLLRQVGSAQALLKANKAACE